MTARSAGSRGTTLLDAMVKGAAVFAAGKYDEIVAATLDSVASYSIDPPSILVSVPDRLMEGPPGRFGISLLTTDQEQIAARLGAGRREPESEWTRLDGVPVVPDALAQLACESSLVERSLAAKIVVGEVLRVSMGTGRPLVVGGGRE